MNRFILLILIVIEWHAIFLPYAQAQTPPHGESATAPGSASGSFLSSYVARASGDQANASRYLEQLLKNDPSNPGLMGQLLVLDLINGKAQEAIGLAKSLKKVDNHELIVDLLLAIEQAHLGRFFEADEHLQGINKAANEALWIPLMHTWLQAGQGKVKQAVETADFSPGTPHIPPFLYYHLALINDYADFTEAAERQYRLAVSDIAHAPYRAVEGLANFYQRHNQPESSDKLLADYAAARPEGWKLIEKQKSAAQAGTPKRIVGSVQEGLSEVLFTMAGVIYTTDQAYDTQLYLQMAVYLRPDFSPAWLMLGSAMEASGSFANASHAYDMVSKDNALYHKALLRKAIILDKQGDPEQAIRMLDSLTTQYPQMLEPLIAKGDLLRGKSKFEEAIAAYTQAIARRQGDTLADWALYFARGACLERTGNLEKAEADLQHALKLNPEQPEALNYLGYMWLMRDSQVAQAAEMISRAYELRPDEPHIIDSMAWVYYKTGRLQDASDLLEQALGLMPNDASINDHLGDVYWQMNRKTEAQYLWKKAADNATDPQLITALQEKLKTGLPPYRFVTLPDPPGDKIQSNAVEVAH